MLLHTTNVLNTSRYVDKCVTLQEDGPGVLTFSTFKLVLNHVAFHMGRNKSLSGGDPRYTTHLVASNRSGRGLIKVLVEFRTVWFTALCTMYDVKLCSLCTQNKQLFFSESCARLSCYPASSGNSLPTLQNNP
jgi:hypothetical protein